MAAFLELEDLNDRRLFPFANSPCAVSIDDSFEP